MSGAHAPHSRRAHAPAGGDVHAHPRTAHDIADPSLAPAGEVDGAGDKGVVVTSVDPEGPAAEHGLKTGDVILNVGGKTVANIGDVRSALTEANANGKHSVLLQVKTADATRFVAVPLAKG